MRPLLVSAALLATALAATSADAHFKLEQPADWLVTDSLGDPMGATGTQKTNPCGDGTRSMMVTKVVAGSTLHVKLTETVAHGGHYRVAFVPKLAPVSNDIPEPKVTLDGSGQCMTADVESPVVAPVIADNLFPHTQAAAVAGKVWETDVQIPNQLGDGTLQIIEFMAPHAPQCFYHHCAQLQVVASAADLDGGAVVQVDGGSSGGGGGTGTGTGGGADGGGAGSGSGGNGAGGTNGDESLSNGKGGCSAAGDGPASPLALGAFGLVLGASLIRRRRRRA